MKRGEITTQQIVLLIILLVSFAIILIFIFYLNPGETTNKEICHNSVVLNDKSAGISGAIDCRTNYVCISGGGDCESLPGAAKIKVNPSKREEIVGAIAKEMADCWWMFGEGNIEYVNPNAFEGVSCSVCSVISFDEKLKEIESIPYIELYDGFNKDRDVNKPGETYIEYVYGRGSLSQLESEFYFKDYFGKSLDFNNDYVVLTGIKQEGYLSPRWAFWRTDSNHLPVTLLEKTKASYDTVGCVEFVTKS